MGDPKQLVNKLWNYCDILRDDGLSYGDYVEQLPVALEWLQKIAGDFLA